jgi:arginine decarboxylase
MSADAKPGRLRRQQEAPYLDALRAYARRDPGRFHIPGHKGGPGADPGLREALGERALALDIPALIEGIDAGPEPTPFSEAQRLAAEAWGARRSWFLVNGASQGNHAACMALAHLGDRVLVQRNVHSSTIDGLILSGLSPSFVAPEVDPELGIPHCPTIAEIEAALEREPEAAGAIVVSPTYFGAIADIAGIAEACHRRGIPLVVDEAWGAHLHFGEGLPAPALELGGDLVLSSVHKIVGSLTQSAILHLGSERLAPEVVDRAVTLVETTSPSALLGGSLDAARRQAATRGVELMAETVEALTRVRAEIREIPGLDVLDERLAGRPGVHAWDPLRLAVDVRGTGCTGHEVARFMHDHDDVNLELFTESVVVAVFGMGGKAASDADRLLRSLRHAAEALSGARDEARPFAPPPPWGSLETTPREAFLGPQEVVPLERAEGRVAAESLAAYPPGVPNVLPGERITGPTVRYLREMLAHGSTVRGASDRTVETVRVVAA